jgi:hypothetical protein
MEEQQAYFGIIMVPDTGIGIGLAWVHKRPVRLWTPLGRSSSPVQLHYPCRARGRGCGFQGSGFTDRWHFHFHSTYRGTESRQVTSTYTYTGRLDTIQHIERLYSIACSESLRCCPKCTGGGNTQRGEEEKRKKKLHHVITNQPQYHGTWSEREWVEQYMRPETGAPARLAAVLDTLFLLQVPTSLLCRAHVLCRSSDNN